MAATRKASDTSRKRRERRTFLAADTEVDLEFMELEIRKYCPKRIFDIIVINGEDSASQEQMIKIIDSFRKYEDTSSVTFIKYSEVIGLIEKFDYSIIPLEVRPILETVLEETRLYVSIKKIDKISTLKMAILMKIKLMEVMIKHYKRELDKMKTRKVLVEELDNLTKIDRKNVLSRRESIKRNKVVVESNGLENLDTESDVIFDDDIYNHVWFYAFEGIYNSKVLSMLLSGKVPITAIIKVDSLVHEYISPESIHAKFWSEMDDLLFSHNRSEIFENTMLMQFTMKGEEDQDTFQDFLHTVKYISEIKFQHLNYIRHIQIYGMDHFTTHVPLHCMHTYNKLVSNIPLELVSEVVVLSSVLEEICVQMDGDNINDKYSIPDLPRTAPVGSRANCPDLHLVNQIQSGPQKNFTNVKTPINFQCYHKDVLSRILNMYKPSGKLVYDLSLNVLKCIHPFNLLDDMMICEANNATHKHDVDPTTKLSEKGNVEVFNHFLNLFVFCTFQYTEKLEESPEKEKFTENLLTYDHVAFCNNLRPKLEQKVKRDSELYFDLSYNINPMDFYWKESYPSFILMQEILKTQNYYSYVDTTYCPETDRVLVQFCDWLDEFGLNTRIYHETLLTPVCLRDFCRYTANEISNWIKDNPPPKYVRKSEQAEICKGARKLKNVDMFEEYRYLLETESMPNTASNTSHFPGNDDLTCEVTFDEMMNELETYPQNTKLKEEYMKQAYSKDFLAYDFGTKYFALRGARTIFVSHDGVKIHVENCKFLDENDKCTVSLQYGDNTLTLHSSENFRTFYSCHWILADETIVVFEIQKKRPKVARIDPDLDAHDDKLDIVPTDHKSKIDISKIKIRHKDTSVDSESHDSKKKEFVVDKTMNLYEGVCEAIEHNCPIYKVNKGYQTLKPIKPIEEIPIATVLHRILQNVKTNLGDEGETGQARTKRYVPIRAPNVSLPMIESAIFRITLPNGIHVTCYPSLVKETLIEVKQELLSPHIEAIKSEEFRLFTREGYILIKKIDGCITILMSNGNKIDFDKPNTEKESIKSSNLKPVHCKTVNDYRKRLNKLMKDTGKTNDDYYISRRGVLETKRGYIINQEFIKILESTKLPYLKTSLLNFDGTKIVLEGNKISQKKLFYTISENDFCEEEIYYERKDGFKCILHRTATKTVQYPDGTRITTNVLVATELVDGYVYISLFYKYEHPHYATVSYSDGDLLQVILDNLVIEKSKDNLCTLRIDPEAKCTIDTECVTFEKTCKKCCLPFKCTFDISPFHNNFFEFAKQFVHAEDSYLKHFFVDYSGICRVNRNYIVGPVNASDCNHVESNAYKKLYAIKKTMSGEEFFTDNMVNSYIEQHREKENITVVKTGKAQPIIRFQYNYYQPFTERLLTKSVINNPITLTKYNTKLEKNLYYSTIKVLSEIINAKKIQILLSFLIQQLYQIDIDDNTLRLIQWLADKKEDEAELKRLESEMKKENLKAEQAKYCICIKDKRTFARKIMQWGEEFKRLKKILKEGKIPMYFDSEFCQKIKRR